MDFIHQLQSRESGLAVSLEEAREQIEAFEDESDAKLNLWIPAATEMFERLTRRALLPQTWLLESEDAVREIELPRPPLISITSVKSKERIEEDWEDVADEDYTLQSNRSPARLTWLDGQPRFVQVIYTAGHANVADIPGEYRMTILQLVAFFAENRGDVEAKMPIALRAMIAGQSAGTKLGYWSD
jgi:uncharacterized phiE125 gp8 family phage protein